MAEDKSKVVEKEDQDDDKSEVLGNLVKVVVLIWSASLLHSVTLDFQMVRRF